ncbi:MAG: sialate O-acetylesterase [Opitutaceae bacterium]|nr:sialate O-acetylesterase [Opitutaceae bacterium]
MSPQFLRFFFASLLAGPAATRADVMLAPLFQDHAVLQCDRPLPVWGMAKPREKITVYFRDQEHHVTADKKGHWQVRLDPLPATSEPAQLVVTGRNTVRIADVVVGEVWLCSGQSNIELPTQGPPNTSLGPQNAAQGAAVAPPLIRQFAVDHVVAEKPAATVSGAWSVCSPEAVGRFNAVGYFFARDLHLKLGVPIGIINSTWDGTPIEAWMSAEALASDPAFQVIGERWKKILQEYPSKKSAQASGLPGPAPVCEPPGPGHRSTPAGLYNGMIAPLMPFAIRGVLWDQDEANASRYNEYRALFPTLIMQWRQAWEEGDFPFYFVQLANCQDDAIANRAYLREAQTQALVLPATGMAVTIDMGASGNIHPASKQEIGRRLALIARTQVYGIPGDWSGPIFLSAQREGAAMRVHFAHADGSLTAHDKPPAGFEIAGHDRKFYRATARLERDTVLVSSPEVKEPVAVRYAWANAPEANLYNGAGLPAAPFRSDNW